MPEPTQYSKDYLRHRLLATDKGSSLWTDGWGRLKNNTLAIVSLGILCCFCFVALFTPIIAPYGYEEQNLILGAVPPSLDHWLGTDIFGRDMLTRIMYGSRISLAVGFLASAVAVFIGVLWGSIAGYFGGRTDIFMMRLVDILYALPFMIFIVLLIFVTLLICSTTLITCCKYFFDFSRSFWLRDAMLSKSSLAKSSGE